MEAFSPDTGDSLTFFYYAFSFPYTLLKEKQPDGIKKYSRNKIQYYGLNNDYFILLAIASINNILSTIRCYLFYRNFRKLKKQ